MDLTITNGGTAGYATPSPWGGRRGALTVVTWLIEARLSAAVRVHHMDFEIAVAAARERDPAAVRRPGGMAVEAVVPRRVQQTRAVRIRTLTRTDRRAARSRLAARPGRRRRAPPHAPAASSGSPGRTRARPPAGPARCGAARPAPPPPHAPRSGPSPPPRRSSGPDAGAAARPHPRTAGPLPARSGPRPAGP